MNQKKEKALLYADHAKPKTRREFLSSGLIAATGCFFAPNLKSLMNLKPSELLAAEYLIHDKMNIDIPFLCFDAAGGMNLAGGNVIVGFGAGEDQEDFGSTSALSDYIKMGLPPTMHPSITGMIDETYGIKLHSTSGLLEGLNSILAPVLEGETDLRQSVDGLFVCAITGDDTNGNPLNTAYMARKAGSSGSLVQLIGSSNTDSGGNSVAPEDQIDLLYRPTPISRFSSGESLISIGDAMMGNNFLNAGEANFGAARLKAFMDRVKKIGLSRYGQDNLIKKELEAKSKLNEALSGANSVFDQFSPNDLNPSKNESDRTILESIFGTGQDETYSIGGAEEKVASIINLVTKRVAGTGVISVGGYDYHDGTSGTGNTKDYMLGRYMGQAIKMAAARGQNLFIHVYTDGGVVGDVGGAIDDSVAGKGRVKWRSDSGTRSGALMLAYRHGFTRVDGNETSNMLLAGKKRQIGNYIKAGGADPEATSVSNNVAQLWKSIVLNYLSCITNTSDQDEAYALIESVFEDKYGDLPPDWKELIRFKPFAA